MSKAFILPHLILNRKRTRVRIMKDKITQYETYYISWNIHSSNNVELPSSRTILPDIIQNWNRTRVQIIKDKRDVVWYILYLLQTFIYQLIVSGESNYTKDHGTILWPCFVLVSELKSSIRGARELVQTYGSACAHVFPYVLNSS
jgi:hypothetical protein